MPFNPNTNTFTPASVSGYFPSDLYNFGAESAVNKQRSRKPQFAAKVIESMEEGEIVAWRLIVEDTQGGLNLTQGRFDLDFDRVSSSTLDTRFYKTLVNQQLTSSTGSPAFDATLTGLYGVHSAHFNDLLHVAAGDDTNSSLLKETSTTNPTLAAVTYTPPGAVTSLTTTFFGGDPYLLVGRSGGAAEALDTVYAANATSLNNLWGVVQTFIGDQDLLVYHGTTIGVLSTTGAWNAVPTTTLSNVPGGGTALGLLKLAGAPVKAAWIWPFQDFAWNAVISSAAFGGGRVVVTNQEGTDYQYLPVGLHKVQSAVLLNDSAVISTDFKRITYYDGRSQARDLYWASQREPNPNYDLRAVGLGINGNELIVEVNAIPSAGALAVDSSLRTLRWRESYNFETNAWHFIGTIATAATTTTQLSAGTPNGIPISKATNYVHTYVNGDSAGDRGWNRMFLPFYGYNPYNMFRQTADSNSGAGYEFELSGTYTSPYWTLPGLDGCPSMVSKITFMGDVDSGGTAGTAATVTVTAGNMTGTFITGLERRAQVANVQDTGDIFYQLQVSITQTRNNSSSRWTPQGLPVMIEGFSWVPKLHSPGYWYDDIS